MNLVKTHCAILCLPVVHTLRKMYCVLRDMYVVGILRYLQHLCTLEGASIFRISQSYRNVCTSKSIFPIWKGQQISRYRYQPTNKLDMKAKKSLFAPPNLYPLQNKRQRQQYGVVASNLDAIQDFLCKLSMKPHRHLVD